jgi:hypothetical protein
MTDTQRLFGSAGAYVMSPAELNVRLGVNPDEWARFGSHWDDLAADPYAAELGTRRLRRYGRFVFTTADGIAELMPHRAFVQPQRSNPLYIGHHRHFEPLTETFAKDPLLHRILRFMSEAAAELDDTEKWDVKVTPFRVLACTRDAGQPTPEGPHRDGVTMVTSLLIRRRNAVGGRSSVFDADGRCILSTTLREPGSLLLGDDRRTFHGVSAIRPRDRRRPAVRDVLVVTFAPSSQAGHRRRR